MRRSLACACKITVPPRIAVIPQRPTPPSVTFSITTAFYPSEAPVNVSVHLGSLATNRRAVLLLPIHAAPQLNVLSRNRFCFSNCLSANTYGTLAPYQQRERLSFASLGSLLQQCAKDTALPDGRLVHAYICTYGHDCNTFLENSLIQMYGNCGRLADARKVFETILNPNPYSWNILLNTYVQNGAMATARCLFGAMPFRDVVSWNSMIAASTNSGYVKGVSDLLFQMQLEGIKPNRVTFVCLLEACAYLEDLKLGQDVHAVAIAHGCVRDIVVGNVLVNMYGKCKDLNHVRSVFEEMPEKDVVSWSSVIAAYVQNEQGKDALTLYSRMLLEGIAPNTITIACILEACAKQMALQAGQKIHAVIFDSNSEQDIVVGTALVNMYSKCANLEGARMVFSRIPHRDVVSWSAMIAACFHNGHLVEALDVFDQMQLGGVRCDQITYSCVLDVCAHLAALERGQKIHSSIVDDGYENGSIVGPALVNMYGKSGVLFDARNVFATLPRQGLVSWNGIIAAYAQSGHDKETLAFVHQMSVKGVKPDRTTLISVLTAFSHSGLVHQGIGYFMFIKGGYNMTDIEDQCLCIVDLLGRAGCLGEVENLINSLPFRETSLVWLSLLSACKTHNDVQRGICASKHCFELDFTNVIAHVMLSNIYGAAGRWADKAKLREKLDQILERYVIA